MARVVVVTGDGRCPSDGGQIMRAVQMCHDRERWVGLSFAYEPDR